VSRFRFISEQRATFGVKRLCRVLGVHRSGFYAWLGRADRRADRSVQDDRLVEQIRQIHADTTGTYGSPRVTAELHAQGVVVNHKRVERLMREHEIVGVHLRRRHRTTRRDPAAQAAPDLLGRDLHRSGPGSALVWRHHLPAGGRPLPVPGHRAGSALAAAGRLVPGRPRPRRAGR
jgi:transposase InsO family protein